MLNRAFPALLCFTAAVAHAQCNDLSAHMPSNTFFKDGLQVNAADLNCFGNNLMTTFLPRAGGTVTGALLSTTSGRSQAVGDNVPTLDFLGNTINFQRRILTGSPPYPGTRVFLDNYSKDYKPQPWGGFPDVPAFEAIATSHAGSTGTLSALYGNILSQGNNPYTSQDQALVGVVTKTGQNSTWGLSVQNQDNTGLPPRSFASVGAEIDLVTNGPDTDASLYNPSAGNRWMLLLSARPNPVNGYRADALFAAGTLVMKTPKGGVPTVFVAQNTGTTGPSEPTWPSSGTVSDGAVRWLAGVPFETSVGSGLTVSAVAGASYNSAIAVDGRINNASIDLTDVVLAGGESAAIRLAHNAPIDFSGTGGPAGQNQHILQYSSTSEALTYTAKGKVGLSVSDTGLATFPGQMQAPLVTPKSSSSPCVTGTRIADADFEYVCVATNTWKRAALSAF